jgi:TetR/AcrR family transcriptional regulator, transcriptional repressor for nem operon
MRNGFSATSVDEVLAAAGSSKGAFFHHFPTKRALAAALVERYVDADLRMLQEGLDAASAARTPAARVTAFLGFYERAVEDLVADDTSCLYMAVLTERDLPDDATAGAIERAVVAWRDAFVDLLVPALPPGCRVDPAALADHLFVTFEGSYLLCRSLGSAEPMRAQLRVLRQLVEALLQV